MSPRNFVKESTMIPEEDSDPLHLDVVENSDDATESSQKQNKSEIVWRNVVLFLLLHLAAVYSLTLIPKAHPATWLWAIFYYLFSAVGITAGAHRLWSHRTYKAKTLFRILLAIMQSSAFQNDILDWSRDHRVHHKYSETDADPHNAKRGFFFSHIGWLLVRKHPNVKLKGKTVDLSDLYSDKVVTIQRKFYKLSVLVMCFLVPTVVPNYFWGESLWNAFFLAGILRYTATLNATWLVNSAAHIWGNRPYDKTINPAENMFVVLSAAGEGFHNYHHVFPQDYATSEFGWHKNLTTMFIDFMAYLGQASDRRSVSPNVILKRSKRTGDGTRCG